MTARVVEQVVSRGGPVVMRIVPDRVVVHRVVVNSRTAKGVVVGLGVAAETVHLVGLTMTLSWQENKSELAVVAAFNEG